MGNDRHLYRYFAPGVRVELAAGVDLASRVGPAGWHLSADTEDDLFRLYEQVWPCHGFPVQVYTTYDRLTRQLRKRFAGRFPDASDPPSKRGT